MGFNFKKILVSISAAALLLNVATPSRADSPITSTNFSEAYQSYDIVKRAKETGTLDLEMAEYLSSPSTPIDIKAALINALSWNIEGKRNAMQYRQYLGLTYNQPMEELRLDQLSDDELFSLGYLTVMDDYFKPEKAQPYLEAAQQRKPKSYTVAMVNALTQAQAALDSDRCQVWRVTEKVVNNSTLDQDLKPAAQKIILDYMRVYEESCR
ncbi:hypothetical protein [Acaryochloris thomasi]|nr:hypothetical protein [Acaryochloris thomasi]